MVNSPSKGGGYQVYTCILR